MPLIRSPLVERVIGCAIQVHHALGPGLLESAYSDCLTRELTLTGCSFERQVVVPFEYKGTRIKCAYRADFVVERTLLLERKSIDRLAPIHQAQTLAYLKLLQLHQGLLINFNVKLLVHGLRSVLL